MNYTDFLGSKRLIHRASGFSIDDSEINPILFDHQKALVKYALRKGKAAIFADTGLGKTPMILEWCHHVVRRTQMPVCIVAPLYVAHQTVEMAKDLLDYDIHFTTHPGDIGLINITNYENIHKFEKNEFIGWAFDESSIFKGMDSKTFKLAEMVSEDADYILCASATPSPNSIDEMGKQAQALDVLSHAEMRATFFINRQGKEQAGGGWSLRPHAKDHFYRWLASWAMAIKKPSDLGYDDTGYDLPPLSIENIFVKSGYVPAGQLMHTGLNGITGRAEVRKATIEDRCQRAAELINGDDDQWIVWCGFNKEADRMHELIPDSVNVQGSDSTDSKIDNLRSFARGETRVLVSKTKICGQGANFQNCHKMIFVGLSDSFEQFYQAIKRIHRFGQDKPVEVYVVLAQEEDQIWHNVQRKQQEAERMTKQLIENADQYQREEMDGAGSNVFSYATADFRADDYFIMLGDSAERLQEIESDSVHLSVYSPPFADLFTYSKSERDLGNSRDIETFLDHYEFIVKELLRASLPGRVTAVHVMDIPAMKGRDGYIGVKDFSGEIIRLYERCGWVYKGRIPIGKNPQAVSIRTRTNTLTFAQFEKDSIVSMPVQGDYLLKFAKPGENPIPVTPIANGEMSRDTWIEWAGYTWTDISETNVLPYRDAKGEDDVKHICPLQLDVPERAIKLWSNPGERVLTPFMGVGTEVYQAVKFDRYGIGIELNPNYFNVALKNVQKAASEKYQLDLFSMAGVELA